MHYNKLEYYIMTIINNKLEYYKQLNIINNKLEYYKQ